MSRSKRQPIRDDGSTQKSGEKSLRQRMRDDLQLRGLAKRTCDGYLREVRKLCCYYGQSPDQLCEQQVGDYLLHLINDCEFAPGSLKVSYNGIKFFYTYTEPRDWDVLTKLRIPKQKTLPDVMTVNEVRQLLGGVRQLHHRVYFWTIYTLGLRLEEGLHLQVGDIDAQRMTVHVHRGKGAKDRLLPLPVSTLQLLRDYWSTHRNPNWLFPSLGRSRQAARRAQFASTTNKTMNPSTVQGCMQQVVEQLGFKKDSRHTRFVIA